MPFLHPNSFQRLQSTAIKFSAQFAKTTSNDNSSASFRTRDVFLFKEAINLVSRGNASSSESELLHSQPWQPKHSKNLELEILGEGKSFNEIFTLNCVESIISQSITVHCGYLLLPNLFSVSPLLELNDVDAQHSSTLTHIIKTSMTPFSWKEFLDAWRLWAAKRKNSGRISHTPTGDRKGWLPRHTTRTIFSGSQRKFARKLGEETAKKSAAMTPKRFAQNSNFQ